MSEPYTLVVRSTRVVLPDGVREAAVVVRDDRIERIAEYGARLGATTDTDLGELALLPGLVDTHVHVNEGFATATRAAAAGGITTICDMPLSSVPENWAPVTTTVDALRVKAAAAAGQCAVDVALWGGAVPSNFSDLGPLSEAGVVGFKCFLVDSGVPGFPPLARDGLRSAMGALADSGIPMIVHAEDPAEVHDPSGPGYDAFVASRPPVAERRAIETVLSAAAATGARAHIAHLAAAECAALIGAARAAGISLSAETCPHYLFFAAEEVPADATGFTCCPPVRYAPNREALWRALTAGVVSCVVSGHSPGGVSSLALAAPAVWTVARRRGLSLPDIARWMAEFPADLAGLPAKGRLAAGCDADLVAFDPDASFTVQGDSVPGDSVPWDSPYGGRTLTGRVSRVWLRGEEVFTESGEPRGRLLRRGGGFL
jgi:allantoinase